MKCFYNIRILNLWGIQAITLYPFILFAQDAKDVSTTLFRHELEHIYQVQRLGWFGLYFSYLKFYCSFRLKGNDHFTAYWSNPYELEARAAESQPLTERELALFEKSVNKSELPS